HRPPMAVVGIVDDGGETAEWVRVREDKITIGRSEGEICIPQDSAMSSRHLEIVRMDRKGRLMWTIRDLKSTNGTFVRTASALLQAGQEFLFGLQRFRVGESPGAPAAAGNVDHRATMGWQKLSANPAGTETWLIRIRPTGEEPCLKLQSGEYTI